jgi:UDP-glucose 4-epimerase
MKIIVTGAAGFIGTNLLKTLARNQAHDIFAVTRNQAEFSGVTWVHADLSDSAWTQRLPENADVVIHLAQSKRYREFPDGAADMIRININATAELLEWSRTHGVQKFIFASTGNVYQRTEKKLLKETDVCVPDSMYSATKLSAEYIVQQYSAFFKTMCLRIFGVYGPGQKDMLVPRLIDSVENGREITLDGGEGLSLSPLYIDDCVEIISRLLKEGAGIQHEIYNLAGNEVLNLKQMVEIIGEQLLIPVNTVATERAPQFFAGENKKICDAAGYTPQTEFKRGISSEIVLKSDSTLNA